jgi:DNA-binding PadR family transcriptional regulator
VKGHLDLVLLGALARSEGHGYALMAWLKAHTDGAVDLPEGLVYPALHRLEDAGLVTSSWGVEAGRRRRCYRLTADGTKALAAQRSEWRRLVDAVDAVLAGGPSRVVLA